MLARLIMGMAVIGMLGLGTGEAWGQSRDMSPTLLIESGPSDLPGYRRMVFVKYLAGDRVTASYKAYNRSEFHNISNDTPVEIIQGCSRGAATSLRDIDAFEKAERRRSRSGQAPEVTRFCIKGVSGWESGNRDRYTDPIFNGMPLASVRR